MKIIRATESHWGDFVDTHTKSLRESYEGFLPQEWLDETIANHSNFDKWLNDERAELWLCYESGSPIGLVVFGQLRDADGVESDGEIWSIYFRQSAKGQGHAKTALEFAECKLKEKGYSKIYIWCLEENKRARNFYENKNNYKATNIHKDQILTGKAYNEIRFEKVII